MASNNKEEFVVKQEPLEDAPGTRQATPIVTPSIPSGLEAESGLQEAEEDPLRIPRASGLADFSPRAPVFALNYFGQNPIFKRLQVQYPDSLSRPAPTTPKPVLWSGKVRKFGLEYIRRCPNHCVLVLCQCCIKSLCETLPADAALPTVDSYGCDFSATAEAAAAATLGLPLLPAELLDWPKSLTTLSPGSFNYRCYWGSKVVVEWKSKLEQQLTFRLEEKVTQPPSNT